MINIYKGVTASTPSLNALSNFEETKCCIKLETRPRSCTESITELPGNCYCQQQNSPKNSCTRDISQHTQLEIVNLTQNSNSLIAESHSLGTLHTSTTSTEANATVTANQSGNMSTYTNSSLSMGCIEPATGIFSAFGELSSASSSSSSSSTPLSGLIDGISSQSSITGRSLDMQSQIRRLWQSYTISNDPFHVMFSKKQPTLLAGKSHSQGCKKSNNASNLNHPKKNQLSIKWISNLYAPEKSTSFHNQPQHRPHRPNMTYVPKHNQVCDVCNKGARRVIVCIT